MTGEDRRVLIVNADDFGLSEGVNRGIILGHEQGIVTSASLMVLRPGAGAAAEYARAHSALAVGLHLDFGEWEYRGGEWVKVIEGVALDDARAVADEVNRQLELFDELVGQAPTHLDSHQHVHLHEPLRSVVAEVAARVGVPARRLTPGIRYCGGFYGQDAAGGSVPEAITAAALLGIIAALPAGITELACHPGVDAGRSSAYGDERALEVRALCDPSIRAAIATHRIELRSFAQLLT